MSTAQLLILCVVALLGAGLVLYATRPPPPPPPKPNALDWFNAVSGSVFKGVELVGGVL